MTYAPVRVKQPAEVRTITFDFTSKLVDGDSVNGIVGNALVAAAGITVGAPSRTGNTVTALVSGGAVTSTYRISCRVTTTLGETLELDVDVRVAAGEN